MRRTRTATILLALLVAGSAAAFLRAEQLKLERSPVAAPDIQKFFSATCTPGVRPCRASHRAAITFKLREPATAALAVVDGSGRVVRSLSGPERHPKGFVRTSWDGRTGAGRLAPDGTYHLRVDLVSLDRTITVPDPLNLDNTPPVITVTSRPGAVPVRYRLSERARVYATATLANGTPEPPRHVFRGRRGAVRFRRVHRLPKGASITLDLVAVDPAGNRSRIVRLSGLEMPA